MPRRLLISGAAVALVLSGIAMVLALANSTAAASDSRTVLVATGDVAPGTPAAKLAGAVSEKQVSAALVPDGAITDLAQVANLQTTQTVFGGAVLMARQFAETSATGGLPIPPGRTALAVKLDDPERVAGFVQPGSKVMVFANVNEQASLLLKDAPVVAVGPSTAATTSVDGATDDSNSKDDPSTVVTFALTPEEATKVVAAVSNGQLYLGLLPS